MQARGELLIQAQNEFIIHDLRTRRAQYLLVKLVHYLLTHKPDALLAAMYPLTIIAPLTRLLGYCGSLVISEHTVLSEQYKSWTRWDNWLMREFMKIAYPLADARIAVSKGILSDLAKLSGLPMSQF